MQTFFQRQRKWQKIWAFLILPITNITALCLADPLYENITHIAYAKHQLPFVCFWAFTCAYYLWCYTNLFLIQMHYKKKRGYFFLTLSTLFMIISVCIPYQEENPWLSHLHVDVAMISTIAYIVLFCYFLTYYHFYDPLRCQKIFPYYLTIISFLLLLFLLVGSVCTWMESLFVMFMGWLHVWIQKQYDEPER